MRRRKGKIYRRRNVGDICIERRKKKFREECERMEKENEAARRGTREMRYKR